MVPYILMMLIYINGHPQVISQEFHNQKVCEAAALEFKNSMALEFTARAIHTCSPKG